MDAAQEGTAHVGHGLLAIRSELGSFHSLVLEELNGKQGTAGRASA